MDVLNTFLQKVNGHCFVAHDIHKDLNELNTRLSKYDLPILQAFIADTEEMVRGAHLECDLNLKAVADSLQLGEFQEHNAYEDAMMHARVYEWLMHRRELDTSLCQRTSNGSDVTF